MDKSVFMQACREGGARIEAALRVLDAEFSGVLRRECRTAVRDPARADDLVQDTFIKVWQRCASYRGEAELLGWIRGILRHAIIDFFRAARPEEPLEDEEGEMSVRVAERVAALSMAARDKPDDLVSLDEQEATYRRCFARFEVDCPLHAAVMRWIAEDGMSNAEIEGLIDRSPGATREFISQCRKKARVYFAEWYELARTAHGG